MSKTNETENDADGTAAVADEPQSDAPETSTPEFQDMKSAPGAGGAKFEMQRFAGVQVVLTAELGRTQVTIQELMSLSEGAVLELNRPISAPVELMAQGVPLGNGEVVVIEDRFAIRIKEIYQS
ncbi:FliM/FliN family flagellar motor switch protein [Planctomycetes bacterium K23_9]|uniref:Flagellar motor switch protein FliN n=1 Tax=Stieleria marina TaxID=1930275 RepID=A0A517NT26_9BACT|nr:Flagellar motor switch protein FliN [Planctomycetes bacterium K23_9]